MSSQDILTALEAQVDELLEFGYLSKEEASKRKQARSERMRSNVLQRNADVRVAAEEVGLTGGVLAAAHGGLHRSVANRAASDITLPGGGHPKTKIGRKRMLLGGLLASGALVSKRNNVKDRQRVLDYNQDKLDNLKDKKKLRAQDKARKRR